MYTRTREELIGEIRAAAERLGEDGPSLCELAGRLGVGCRGFKRLDDAVLLERYAWIVRAQGATGRERVEELAKRWALARQLATGRPVACDVEAHDRDTCRGWDEMSDERLRELHRALVVDAPGL